MNDLLLVLIIIFLIFFFPLLFKNNRFLIGLVMFLFIMIIMLPKHKWSGKNKPSYTYESYLRSSFIKEMHKLGIIKLNKEVCYDNLKTIHTILKKHKIPFWLSEGTALGFKREKDFIGWDDDLDIAVKDEYYKQFIMIIKEFLKNGFEISNIETKNNFISLIRNGEKIDIDFIKKGSPCASWKYSTELCDPLIPYVQEFDKITIKNKVYNIPKDGYFIKLYGKDWKIPKKGDKGVANGVLNLFGE